MERLVLERDLLDDSRRERQSDEYTDLLAQVRRLTGLVLDLVEEGKKNKTMLDRDTRILVGAAARLFRFWKTTMKEAAAQRILADRMPRDSRETV
jgi:hypothetical protein